MFFLMQIPIVSVFDAHKGLWKVVFFFYPPYLHLFLFIRLRPFEKEKMLSLICWLPNSNAGRLQILLVKQ